MEWNIDPHHDLSGYSRDGRACSSLMVTNDEGLGACSSNLMRICLTIRCASRSFASAIRSFRPTRTMFPHSSRVSSRKSKHRLYKRKALLRLFGETGERAVGLSRVDVSNGQCPRHDGRRADVVA